MKNFGKEKFKTVLLILLFILSIGLNQQLGVSTSIKEILPSLMESKVVEVNSSINIKDNISDILSPQSFCINFGGGLHTVLYTDIYGIWKETLQSFKDGYFKENVLIQEINKEQWIEASKFPSVEVKFGYSMPMSLIIEMIDKKEAEVIGKIEALDSMVIPLMDDAGIYMGDSQKGKYYLVKGKSKISKLYEIVKTIEQNGYEAYYPMRDLYGIENDQLMPIELDSRIHGIQVIQELDPTNDGQVEAFAGTFFGENLDFVRKIIETSGSVIYMYGYGQKALKIDDLGVLQYLEEIDNEKAGKNVKVEDAIKIAFKFVREHGSWANIDAYLKKVKPIEKENKKGYEIFFDYRLNGLPVYYGSENKIIDGPIEVCVLGEQVITYKRVLKREKIAVNFLDNQEDTAILSASQVVDMNFEHIKEDFLKHKLTDLKDIDEEKMSKEVLASIKSVEMGYYDQPTQKQNKLIPVWVIKTNEMIYYFNAYNGKLINGSEI